MTTPKAQIESWIREQAAKDGMPISDADYERLTKRVLLAHKEEIMESPMLQRYAVRFALEALADYIFNRKPR